MHYFLVLVLVQLLLNQLWISKFYELEKSIEREREKINVVKLLFVISQQNFWCSFCSYCMVNDLQFHRLKAIWISSMLQLFVGCINKIVFVECKLRKKTTQHNTKTHLWIEWRWRRCVLGEGDSHLNKYLKCLRDTNKRYNTTCLCL